MSAEDEKFLDRLKEIADAQIEHCDAILILASGPATDKEGGTIYYRMQRGNNHATEGLAREYLRRLDSHEQGYHMERGRRELAREEDGFE